MSTTFGLFKVKPELFKDGCVKDISDDDFIICARRTSGGMIWMNNFDIISIHLPDDVPVYPLDNTPQNIFCIGDVKKEIKT